MDSTVLLLNDYSLSLLNLTIDNYCLHLFLRPAVLNPYPGMAQGEGELGKSPRARGLPNKPDPSLFIFY